MRIASTRFLGVHRATIVLLATLIHAPLAAQGSLVGWAQKSTFGPTARLEHAMTFDSLRGRTVLFGGLNAGNFGDTWEWNGSAWTQVAATGPTGRSMHAMAYDSQRGRTVVFGGWSGFTIPSYLGDTWEWNGTSWTQVATTGPTGHRSAAMAYDSQRGRTVLFGGWDTTTGPNGPILGDTWEWSGPLAGTATAFGTGCGGPALLLSQIANARPTIGTTAQAALTNIPSSLAFVAVGWSNTIFGSVALPLTLAPYGMPGCDLLQSAEAAAIPTTATGPGTAIFSWSLPPWSGLIGLHVYLQGWASAPGANTANVIVSNGVEWVIGNT